MKKPSSTAGSVNSLADQTGQDRRTIKKLLVNAGLYPPDGRPMADVLEALKPDVSEGSSIKEKKTYEEWRKLKIRNDKEEGKLVSRASVAESIRLIAGPINFMLDSKLENEYPSAVAGLDVCQARVYGKRLNDSIKEQLQQFYTAWEI